MKCGTKYLCAMITGAGLVSLSVAASLIFYFRGRNNVTFDLKVKIGGTDDHVETSHVKSYPTDNESKMVYFYHNDGEKFTDRFVSCVKDNSCQIFYYHMQKAGGTAIGSRMYNWLNNFNQMKTKGSDKKHVVFHSKDWCCGTHLLGKMYANPGKYCHLKFSSWESHEEDFKEIVHFCRQNKINETTSSLATNSRSLTSTRKQFSRAIVLASYREPISRSVSFIHQKCNHLSKIRKETQIACKRCSYADDAQFWDDLVVANTIRELETMQNLARSDLMLPSSINRNDTTHNNKDLNVMGDIEGLFLLDSSFITSFFSSLETSLNLTIPVGKRNKELALKTCDFGMHSTMIKKLEPGLRIYSNLTRGVIYDNDGSI